METIAGRRPVLEALRANHPLHRLVVADVEPRGTLLEIVRLARERGIPVQTLSRDKLSALTQVPHQGVVAMVAAWEYVDIDYLLEVSRRKGTPPFLVLAHEIADPQNLGSLIRTAEACGADGLVVPRHRSAGLTAAIARASAGAVEYLPVARVTSTRQAVADLKERGCWVVGLAAHAPTPIWEVDLGLPCAVVVGSEARGLGPALERDCDVLACLPMRGRIASLNAAVAAAVAMYEVCRQRSSGQGGHEG
ncbi:MAG: 23S rRNA (guanosine(2251)-2'-O)-methyltransferase RlmB [Clostridia bacterium]|nr:MAG: 23S rRNA (guanosine(2251)-2'-O)-methyltransferase RlmB [Clostridia bacterium]